MEGVPELPEIEITARRIGDAIGGVAVESAVKVIRGETVPAQIKVRLELVTKNNLQ